MTQITLNGGLHDKESQIEEAKSVLKLLPINRPLKILDLACGIGTHAIHWAEQGHRVTGVDISETFVGLARKAAAQRRVDVDFVVADITSWKQPRSFPGPPL